MRCARKVLVAAAVVATVATPAVSPVEGLDTLWCKFKVTATTGLNLRSGPGTQYSVVGSLPYNYIGYFTDSTTNGWRQHESSGYPWGSGTYLARQPGSCIA